MKFYITIALCLITCTVLSQAKAFVGTYSYKTSEKSYILRLQEDGSFDYTFQNKLIDQREEKKLGKGTWTSKNKIITFSTSNPYTDNEVIFYNGIKAKSSWKSPLSRAEGDEQEHIQFFNNDNNLENPKFYKN